MTDILNTLVDESGAVGSSPYARGAPWDFGPYTKKGLQSLLAR